MSDEAPRSTESIDSALGPDGRASLVRLAWASVRAAVEQQPLDEELAPASPQLLLYGAFVTLSRDGQLRGCMGLVGRVAAAAELVAEAARLAATGDPRFPPVELTEVNRMELEVSLLTPLEWLSANSLPGAVRVGEHGLVVERAAARGLLLPQVAVEWGWDATRLLEETCRKAGLPRDAWREGARVARFSALVIPAGPGSAQ
jgi:AmmeMemoRadiSam system protein A